MNFNIAYLTEQGYTGKIPENLLHMRTDVAWMFAMQADHYNIYNYTNVKNYDFVFLCFPKGSPTLNVVGSKLINKQNDISPLLASDITSFLKEHNKKICYVQEGPCWFFEEYEIIDQINYYNQLANFDIIFAHNRHDTLFFKGLFPTKNVQTIPTLIIEHLVDNIKWNPQNKVMLSGNFCRWGGGFSSYIISNEFKNTEKWVLSSHCTRENETEISDLNHVSYTNWFEWMKTLSNFKYGINMMPINAAGSFSLNCAYFGIPCVGNIKMDTQRLCFPSLSFDAENLHYARVMAEQLYKSDDYYKQRSDEARDNYKKYFHVDVWIKNMNTILDKC
jgi:hypothetical protein